MGSQVKVVNRTIWSKDTRSNLISAVADVKPRWMQRRSASLCEKKEIEVKTRVPNLISAVANVEPIWMQCRSASLCGKKDERNKLREDGEQAGDLCHLPAP